MNVRHAWGSIELFEDRDVRTEVEVGSNPDLEGVTSALRFWVMESSTAPRDMRRKSGEEEVRGVERLENSVYLGI